MANSLFSSKDFKPELLATFYQSIPKLEEKKQVIHNWQKAIENGRVQKSKEEQIKGEFLDKFFGQVLGYAYESHEAEWNVEKELKSSIDGKKPDAALGFFDQHGKKDVRCVIEVKGALINLDKKQNRTDFTGSSVDQAFNYVPRMLGKCEWVIVTNMIEIRFYSRSDISRYETFLIPELLQPNNLQRFFFLLSASQLFLERGTSRIDQLFSNKQAEQKKIGAEFYSQYRDIRQILFANLFKENPSVKPKELFRVTQKLIDRLIFIGFVRDLRLVDNVLTELNQNIKTSFRKDNQKGWGELKELFNALNEGYTERNIPPFNGELFKPDALLDLLVVRDHQIMPLVKLVQDYDFQSQLDVNILGHIFEQSIADLPEILDEIQKKTPLELAELKPETTTVTKRKKDGIFYTPEYITQYMVKEAVGGWLEDRKKEILETLKIAELPEPEFADYATIKVVKEKVEANETILLNLKFWQAYEKKLAAIKVVDPACGSGAFLNAVFDYLYTEWAKVLKPEVKKLTTPLDKQMLENSTVNEPIGFTYGGDEEWRIKKNIIVNNIFGVDLNGESVEITKLSLWLKTANKTNSLAALYDNIKQGNSLIDDPNVAGDDAFDWHHAFPQIFSSPSGGGREGVGGFDVVVGNPPWGAKLEQVQIDFLKGKYNTAQTEIDTYALFFELGLRSLKQLGKLSFITPDTYLRKNDRAKIREFILRSCTIEKIHETGPLFAEVRDTWCCIGLFKNQKPSKEHKIEHFKLSRFTVSVEERLQDFSEQNWSSNSKYLQINWLCEGTNIIGYLATEKEQLIISKLDKFSKLKDDLDFLVSRGEEGGKDKFSHDTTGDFNLVIPENIDRYQVESGIKIPSELLSKNKVTEFYSRPKIWVIRIQKMRWLQRIVCGYDKRKNSASLKTLQLVVSRSNNENHLKILQAILSSKLINFWCINFLVDDMNQTYLENIPIPNLTKSKNKELTQKIELMLSLNESELRNKFIELLQANFIFEPTKKLKKWYELEFIDVLAELEKGGAKLPAKKQGEWLALFKEEKQKIQHTQAEIAKTDKEIDQRVYQLYNLTPEEIEIVEKA